jgi:hypothetical protein
MSYYYTTSRPSTQKIAKQKPTIEAPQSVADCKLLLKRTDTDVSKKTTSMNDIETHIANFTSQIVQMQKQIETLKTNKISLQEQLKQYDINKSFLLKCLDQLEKQEKKNLYITRCTEFINTYDWVNPDEYHGDSDTPPTKKALPHDLFSYLDYDFQPLDCYTSDEIERIAHYIKACVILSMHHTDNHNLDIAQYNTYAELTEYTYDNEYEHYIIGEIENCDGTPTYSDDDSCCHKRYANVIRKFDNIDLDTNSIISYTRVN